MDKKVILSLVAFLGGVGIILLCILLPLSFSLIQFDEYALLHNRWDETLEYNADKSESGRYFTGLYGNFIKFPRTINLIEFKDGYDGTEDGIIKGGGNSL